MIFVGRIAIQLGLITRLTHNALLPEGQELFQACEKLAKQENTFVMHLLKIVKKISTHCAHLVTCFI